MLGAKPLESVLGAGIDNRDHEAVRAFIRAAADIGLSLLFIWPDSKVPADMRTPLKRRADDKAAQEEAKEAGRRDWQTVKSSAGLALATSDKTVLDRYLKAYIQMFSRWGEVGADGSITDGVKWTKKREDAGEIVITKPAAVNLAVEVGGSGLVVIDCDTAGQVRRWFEANDLDPDDPSLPPPTIITPGHRGPDADPDDPDTWAHSNGGHFYFTVPDELIPVLPRHIGAMTWGGDHGFAVLWDRRYVLIPPSTRPEGAYEQLGHVYELPDWLAQEIIKAGQNRIARAALSDGKSDTDNPELAGAIDQWAANVSWASILEPMGWTPAPRADACGCAVWTAPGVHASPKSATAHDTGCSAGRYTEVNAPLHIWTDNPAEPFASWCAERGTSTVSKLQAVALINFEGNVGKAMDELGVTPDLSVDPDIDPKAGDPDVVATDGDFELPTDVTVTVTDGPDPDAPTPDPDITVADCTDEQRIRAGEFIEFCLSCRTRSGLFVADEEGVLWHATDEDDAAETGGHLAHAEPLRFETSEPVSDDPADLPPDFGKKAKEDSPYPDDVEDPDPDVFDSKYSGVPRIAPFSHWRDMPPPEYIIEGLIEHGGLSCVIGPPGIGKSSVGLDMACHIATGKRWQGRRTLKTKVLYLPGEGLSGAVQRIRAWEAAHDLDLGNDLLLGNGIILVKALNEAWGEIGAYIARQGIGLVIFDTFARMASGLEENSATDVGTAIRRFDKLKELTNAGVMVVHHTAKAAPEIARGSSALNGALDSELLIRPATWDTSQITDSEGRTPGKPIELWTSKQKNSEQLDNPIPLLMINFDLGEGRNAPLITGPNGDVDPMQGEIVMARPLPEPVVDTAIRIRLYLDRLPEQGATRAEIMAAVRPDPYANSRSDAAVYWKQRIAEAVDKGLRYHLIQTLSGTPSGARYIPDTATAEQARTLAAAEITDSD